jgi:hypothetical protein
MLIISKSAVNPKMVRYGVRLYAYVQSRTMSYGTEHLVVYIRKTGMKRWLCSCASQLFIETGRRRNCAHIREVRKKVGL